MSRSRAGVFLPYSFIVRSFVSVIFIPFLCSYHTTPPVGLEPTTQDLEGPCSVLLSYGGNMHTLTAHLLCLEGYSTGTLPCCGVRALLVKEASTTPTQGPDQPGLRLVRCNPRCPLAKGNWGVSARRQKGYYLCAHASRHKIDRCNYPNRTAYAMLAQTNPTTITNVTASGRPCTQPTTPLVSAAVSAVCCGLVIPRSCLSACGLPSIRGIPPPVVGPPHQGLDRRRLGTPLPRLG